ncbi:MAG TPA: amino acid adenylation domain-containing protein [Candidatus Angelobacter sp.]|nr:amino acid adenylation domain-containing protein [Candidatus Angelobacter sp.]
MKRQRPFIRADRAVDIPLSSAQEKLWIFDKINPGSPAYNLSLAFRMSGHLSCSALQKAITDVVQRHEILRTSFPSVNGMPVQRIHSAADCELQMESLEDIADSEQELLRWATEEIKRPFALDQGPLIRARLYRLSSAEHALVLTVHHAVFDGWSANILFRELGLSYAASVSGQAPTLPELKVQYADFAVSQRMWMQEGYFEKDLNYWQKKLTALPSLDLPTEKVRTAGLPSRADSLSLTLPPALCFQIQSFCREQRITSFMLLLAVFKIILARYSGQTDIPVGVPMSGRTRTEFENLVGLFLNILVLRTEVSGKLSFRELLAAVRKNVLEAYEHQKAPFEAIQNIIQTADLAGRTSPIQVMFNHTSVPERSVEIGGLIISKFMPVLPTPKFDITLYVYERKNEVVLSFVYDAGLFAPEQIQQISEHMSGVLSMTAGNLDMLIQDIPLAPPARKMRTPAAFADAGRLTASEDESLAAVFDRVVAQNEERTAIHDAGREISYRTLRNRSMTVASRIESAVPHATRVALLFSEVSEAVVAMLGTLRTSMPYVPLDPRYPLERLQFTVQDARAEIILTQPEHAELAALLMGSPERLILTGSLAEWEGPFANQCTSDSLAYILYTSGSTGRPKGVVQNQRNVRNHIHHYVRNTGITSSDRMTLFSSYCFDAAVMDIFGALLSGAALYPIDLRQMNGDDIAEYLRSKNITVFHSTPTVFRYLCGGMRETEQFPYLRSVVLGGEEALHSDLELFRRHFSDECILVNGFGPTEMTVALQFPADKQETVTRASLPLGWPVANTSVALVNDIGQQAALFGTGEIEITSPNLALGYWNDEDATKQAFLSRPDGSVSYRTGDIGRLLPGGLLEYSGRKDKQIKIRGFRIEPGEIEVTIREYPGIRAVAVAAEDNPQGRRAVAYLVLSRAGTDLSALRGFLRDRLPSYMIPSAFAVVAELPMTLNGKLDRNKLVIQEELSLDAEVTAPAGLLEEQVAGCWAGLLGVEFVGREHSFFELGGDSLLALKFIAMVQRDYGAKLDIRQIFARPALANVAELLKKNLGHQNQEIAIVRREAGSDTAPLSHEQQRLWALEQIDPGTAAYTMLFALKLDGALHVDVLERAVNEVVKRHEILRTRFLLDGDNPIQVIESDVEISPYVIDLSQEAQDAQQEAFQDLMKEQSASHFELNMAPLLRLVLLKLRQDSHILLVAMHHIICDAWSLPLLLHEISELYSKFSTGASAGRKALPYQYADYALWQKQFLQGQGAAEALDYWKMQLQGVSATELPIDFSREASQNPCAARTPIRISPSVYELLKQFARHEGATLFVAVLSTLKVLLTRYTGEDDIVIGSLAANRVKAEFQNTIGFFANNVALRFNFGRDLSFRELVRKTLKTALDAYAYQDMPFDIVVDELQVERKTGRNPLFDIVITWNNTPAVPFHFPDLKVTSLETPRSVPRFDFMLSITENQHNLSGFIEYRSDLFEAAKMERIAAHLVNLLEKATKDPDAPLSTMIFLDNEELRQLENWNMSNMLFPGSAFVHELFEAQAQATPDAIAASLGSEEVSYRELNERSNQLARYLGERGLGLESRVGVMLERSHELVVGILGVLKANAAYVPLDPEWPLQRVEFILRDAEIAVLLTDNFALAKLVGLESGGPEIVNLESCWPEIGRQSKNNLDHTLDPAHLAYVLYTSGSTGKPKGVSVPLSALTNLVKAWQHEFQLGPHDRVLLKSPMTFDVSVWEFFAPLVSGARLVILRPGGLWDLEAVEETIVENKVTVLQMVPTLLRGFVDTVGLHRCDSLRLLVCGGEVFSAALAHDTWKQLPVELVNIYGPTETTVNSNWWRGTTSEAKRSLSLGATVPNVQVYILDCALQLSPIGVDGELYIGGSGLSRCYVRRADLTAARFVPNPFEESGSRLYRTGDRVRRHANGELEFLGRLDHQIKMYGYRIELEEIQATLCEHPAVSEAAVLVRKVGETGEQLAAFVVQRASEQGSAALDAASQPLLLDFATNENGAQECDADELRSFVEGKLPFYMVPAQIHRIDKLPITSNGKLDTATLTRLASEAASERKKQAAPANETEALLVEIWQEVLGVAEIGVDQNFFHMGGDSILAIQASSRARRCGLDVYPLDIFAHQSVRELGSNIRMVNPPQIGEQAPAMEEWQLTPIQHWFFEQKGLTFHHFNQSLGLRLRPGIQLTILRRAVDEIMARHEVLRSRFAHRDGSWVQQVEQTGQNAFVAFDYSDYSPDWRIKAMEIETSRCQATLHLFQGILIRFLYFNLGQQEPGRLFIIAHHLVIDGVSWRILLQDLVEVYLQLARNEAPALARHSAAYGEWAHLLAQKAREEEYRQDAGYWLGNMVFKPLPVDKMEGGNTVGSEKSLSWHLSLEDTDLLVQSLSSLNASLEDILLAILVVTCQDWTRTRGLWIVLEGHGRESFGSDMDLSNTIGWFTSLYPVRIELPEAEGLLNNILATRDQLRKVPHQGNTYGMLRYLSDDPALREKLAALPVPQISFNYLGRASAYLTANELFEGSAPEFAGPAQAEQDERTHLIHIVAIIREGKLRISWRYSGNVHHESTIKGLVANFARMLEGAVDLCRQKSLEAARRPQSDDSHAQPHEPDVDIEDIYSLSPLQEGILFHSLYKPGNDVYLQQWNCVLSGSLDLEYFERAWQRVVDRHAILRTSFVWRTAGRPVQVVQRNRKLHIQELNWSDQPEERHSLLQAEQVKKELAVGIDLGQAPLLKLTLAQLGPEKWWLLVVEHHLIMDGWSLQLIMNEVFEIYSAAAEHRQPRLAPPHLYKSYILSLQRQSMHETELFWRDYLNGIDTTTSLGIIPKNAATGEYRQEREYIPAEDMQAVQRMSREHGLTVNSIVLGAWALVLNYYSEQEDVLFGAVTSGRESGIPYQEWIVGPFINTLPVRVQLLPEQHVGDWLLRIQQSQVQARQHGHAPLVTIQSWSQVPRGTPLFESLVIFENYPVNKTPAKRSKDITISEVKLQERTNYPFTLTVIPGEVLQLKLGYDSGRTHQMVVQELLRNLRLVMQAMAEMPSEPLARISATLREQQAACVISSAPCVEYPLEAKMIHELFEDCVRKTPFTVAMIQGDQQWTYQELAAEASGLASLINSKSEAINAKPEAQERRIGILMNRSAAAVIAVLGILKANAAYVPLDPDFPAERLLYMLQDAGVSLVITQEPTGAKVHGHIPEIQIESIPRRSELLAGRNGAGPPAVAGAKQLAYVMYTSGSTGRPKGVEVEHGSVVNLLFSMRDFLRFTRTDALLSVTRLTFDIAGLEIMLPLITGGKLVIATEAATKDGGICRWECLKRGITVMQATPSTWEMLLATGWSGTPGMKLLCGGEPMPEKVAAGLLQHNIELWNVYGPTETTIWSTARKIETPADAGRIGTPVRNTEVYVLDRMMRPRPYGAVGELYIGGKGLARGYCALPQKTAESFVANPLTEEPGARMYRTGDLARHLPASDLECLGRVDDQVKVRGHRVQLSEIEAVLVETGIARAAHVFAHEYAPGDKRLIAYLTPPAALADSDIRAVLSEKLPPNMIPFFYVSLESFPVNAHGKLDRKLLPIPQTAALEVKRETVAPRTEMESILADIWKEALKIEDVSVNDNFFDLGGHSILLIPVSHQVRQATGVECSILELFTHPTIRSLAAYLAFEGKNVPVHYQDESGLEARRAALRLEWWKKTGEIAIADTESV